jgi:Protein of unknown function (DUF2971)
MGLGADVDRDSLPCLRCDGSRNGGTMATTDEEHQLLADQMERELGKAMARDKQVGPLFHYTDARGFFGILDKRQLWATHFDHLNDSQEFRGGEAIVSEVAREMLQAPGISQERKWFLEAFLHVYAEKSLTKVSDVYVVSLSTDGNLLSQWRAYGSNGTGYAVGFSSFLLPDDEEKPNAVGGLELIRCIYDFSDFRQKSLETLSRIADGWERYHSTYEMARRWLAGTGITVALRKVAELVLRFKHHAFEEEKEWRLVLLPSTAASKSLVEFRHKATGIVPYVPIDLAEEKQPIPLAKVYVGPRQNPDVGVKAAQAMLTAHGYDGASIVGSSGIPFRG